MKDPRPQPIHRKDYRPSAWLIDEVALDVSLGEDETVVRATLKIRRNPEVDGTHPLVLDGEGLTLRALAVDGAPRPESDDGVRTDERTLTIDDLPSACTLTTEVVIRPQDNTALMGLYRSGTTFCTQCEAEGFRRITYYLDRPDIMARFSTRIEAERERYPVLLSNGNKVAQGEVEGDPTRHWVRWDDPFPKPSYLFALVAADLRCHRGSFTTQSGREVALEIWVEPANIDACEHALRSLAKSMQWDEEVFGREYDLDVYMVVAVSDFNMAAMENKGLNIFNAKFVLARPQTATDDDYENIEGVIAHEYFHNWTGNRVTCRDWFQLTLKEGLTVFRDEQFTADSTSAAVKRITDVQTLRTAQFAEDHSPNRHPIRPESYIEMNNFYTVTVYNKGSEVIRMIHTLLGPQGFRKGMDLYFERHDGQAVTCDDFVGAMADGSGVDLSQFSRWYSQSGTPKVSAQGRFDAAARSYTLTLRQQPPPPLPRGEQAQEESDPGPAPGEDDPGPLHIPVALGLVGPDGRDLSLSTHSPGVQVRGTTAICELTEPEQSFVFTGVEAEPVPSLLRRFSAPVELQAERAPDTLAFLMGHDADPFSRWDAAQSFAQGLLLDAAQSRAAGEAWSLDDRFVQAWGRILLDPALDGSLKALMLTLPDERVLGQAQAVVDPDGLHAVREIAAATLADAFADSIDAAWRGLAPQGASGVDKDEIDRRRLRNALLRYRCAFTDARRQGEARADARTLLHEADTMTDEQAALVRLVEAGGALRQDALDRFFAKWKDDPLVLDKWFAVQAASGTPDVLARVRALCDHPDFTLENPNRARSLLGVFSVRNQVRFHDASGGGYALLADKILALDPRNPQVAARLVGGLSHWRRFDAARQALIRAQLARIVRTRGLSRDVYELTSKALGAAPPEA